MKEFRKLSLIKDAPPAFQWIDGLKARDLRRDPFIIILDDFEGFQTLFGTLFSKITGIVVWISDREEHSSPGKFLELYRFNREVPAQIWPVLERQVELLSRFRQSEKERVRLDLNHERLKEDISHISSYVSVVDNLVKTNYDQERCWMVDALTRLINYSATRLKGIPVEQFPRALVEFLGSPFFDYELVGIYQFSESNGVWRLLEFEGDETLLRREIDDFSFNFGDYWTRGRIYYHRIDLDYRSFMFSLIKRKALTTFSNYESTFFSMMVTLGGAFYHLKRLTLEIQEKIIEISNIRTSASIVSGLKENKLTLEKAMVELYISLSLEGLVLGVIRENHFLHDIVLQKGSDFQRWQDLQDSAHRGEDGWIVFDLDDEQGYHYGAVAFRLSVLNSTLKTIQSRVLIHTIPQIILVLSEKRLHQEAITDSLTGLYNRRYLLKMLRQRAELTSLDPTYPLVVIMIDIDHFKLVNEQFGHAAGDYVLRYISSILQETVRDVDIVARYGGEEFIAIINAPIEIARNVSERIRARIERDQILFEEHQIQITSSFGLAAFREKIPMEEVIAEADLNLYRAKREGRNRVIG